MESITLAITRKMITRKITVAIVLSPEDAAAAVDMSDEEKRLAIDNLEEQMLAAAARLDFEKAAKLRDQLMELKGEAAPAPATEPRKRQRRKRRQ